MSDKFSDNIKQRFIYHYDLIKEHLQYLDYLNYDFRNIIDPVYKTYLDEIQERLENMRNEIEKAGGINV